jgi:hypothetical protein
MGENIVIDIITMCMLILGIIMVKKEFKQKGKIFRNIGLMLVVLSLIYILPSFFNGFCRGFLDVAMTN